MGFEIHSIADERLAGLILVLGGPLADSQLSRTAINFKIEAKDITSLNGALRLARAKFSNKHILLVRNLNVLLDSRFCDAAVNFTVQKKNSWSLGAGAGLCANGRVHNAHYSEKNPSLTYGPEEFVIIDAFSDLTILNGSAVDEWLAAGLEFDVEFEAAFIQYSMLSGRLAFYNPSLACSLLGQFFDRDSSRSGLEVAENSRKLGLSEVRSLSGVVNNKVVFRSAGDDFEDSGPLLMRSSDVFNRAISQILEPLSVSIVVRTVFGRPHLLRRLLASIVRSLTPGISLEVLLSTDNESENAKREYDQILLSFPMLKLKLVKNDKANSAYSSSRVRNLIGGVSEAELDYVWIVDDDDYIDPIALEVLAAQIYGGMKPIIFSASSIHEECWEKVIDGKSVLASTRQIGSWEAQGWRTLFSGVNRVPICGVTAPRQRIEQALTTLSRWHDLSEDYAMHIALLLTPDLPPIVEVPVPLTHISMRSTEDTTMGLADRAPWCRDIFGFLHELMYTNESSDCSILRVLTAAQSAPLLEGRIGESVAREISELREQNATLMRQVRYLADRLKITA